MPTATHPSTESSDLRDYVRPIWAHKFLILALVAIATATTYYYFDHKPKVYQSSTSIFVGSTSNVPGLDATASFDSDRVLANQAALLKTEPVATRVARDIGYKGDPGGLLGSIT